MKPPSASQIIREKFARNSRTNLNIRFPPSRDVSPDGSEVSRSSSVKRKADFSYANVTKRSTLSERGNVASDIISDLSDKLEALDSSYATVTSICEKSMENIGNLSDPDISAVLTGLVHAISVLNENQQNITALYKSISDNSSIKAVSNNRISRVGPQRPTMTSLGNVNQGRTHSLPVPPTFSLSQPAPGAASLDWNYDFDLGRIEEDAPPPHHLQTRKPKK